MKRLLAVLLCLVMLFTLAPFSAFAAEGDQVDGAVTNEEQKTEFSVEKAYEEYSALETDELKDEYLSKLTEEQRTALLEFIESLFDVEKAYEEYSALETDEAKEEYLNSLSEDNQKALKEYIEKTEKPNAALFASLAETDVCQIGETGYPSVAAAFAAAADGNTITMVKNSTETESATLTANNVTLDLGTFNITLTTKARAFDVTGSLTVTGSGTITDNTECSSKNNGSIFYVSSGTLTINGGSFVRGENANAANLVYATNSANSKVFVTGGSFTSTGDDFSSIIGKGSKGSIELSGGSFNKSPTSSYIKDGYFSSSNKGIYTIKKLTATVKVGESTSKYATFSSAWNKANTESQESTLTLFDNVPVSSQLTLDATGANVTFDLNGHSVTNSSKTAKESTFYIKSGTSFTLADGSTDSSGSVVGSDSFGDNYGSALYAASGSTCNVQGGLLKKGTTGKSSVHCYNGSLNVSGGKVVGKLTKGGTGTVVITGGTFDFDPSAYVDDQNYTVTENPTGTWIVTPGAAAKVVSLTIGTETTEYTSVEKAYEALPTSLESGQTATIKLLDDVTVSENLSNKIPLTFDLNGNTITLNPNGSENKNQRVFYPAANLTITDSSTDGTGYVDALTNGTAETHYIAYIKSNVTLTICGGHFKSACSTKNFSKGDGASVVLDTSKRSWFNNKLSSIDKVNSTAVTKISTYAACVSDAGHEDCPYTYTNTLATIVYNVNGGIVDDAYSIQKQTDLTYLEGYTVNHSLRVQQPVQLGKIFDHWNTKQDNSGDTYTSGDTINIQSKDVTLIDFVNTVTLYAQWRDPEASEYVASIGTTNYASVMEAFYAANKMEGNTEVKLLQNVSENVKVVSGNDITLDLAGFELRGSGTGSAITNNGTLIIKDSVGSGLVYGEAQSKGGGVENTGTLTLKSGTIDGKAPTAGGAVYVNKGTFTMEGGTVTGSSSEGTECIGTSFFVAKSSDSKLLIIGSNAHIDGIIAAEDTTSVVQISQGQFKSEPAEGFIAKWSECKQSTEDPQPEYPYVVSYKNLIVSTTSRINGTNGTIANVSGGGSYTHADYVTVTTSAVEGFDFLGWYTGYSKTTIGTSLSTSLEYSFYPDEDLKLYAVYKPVTSETFELRVESEGTFTVNGKSYKSYDPIKIDAGSEVTLVYTGGDDNFHYWALIPDEGHSVGERILTTNPTYTFIMSGNISLCAGEKSTESDTAMTIYKSYYGQVLAAGNSNTQEGYSGHEPGYPSRLGYKFIKWVFSDNTAIEATDENIIAKIPDSNGFIYIEPLYEADSAEYNITVKYVNETLDQSVKDSDNVKLVNGKAELEAPEIQNKTFLYWKDYVTLSILSYKTEYTVRACNETTIYAVYGDAELEADVCVNITNIVNDTVSEKQHVAITETFSLPDGCTLINTGFVYYPLLNRKGETPEEVPTCAEMRNRLVMGAEDTLTEYSKINGIKDGTFIMNLYAPTTYYVNVYARAFVQYTKDDGNIYVQYSDVYSSKEIAV